jgi:tetratricopeptide (TPR) repeat protein
MKRLLALFLFAFVLSAALPGVARGQQLELHVESEEIYANLPFVLQVVATGFAEEPRPTLSKPQIPGCKVTALGVVPNVSRFVQIINGQRTESQRVSFAFRFRVEASAPGAYSVPALVAEQGGKKVQSQPARFVARSLDETADMKIRIALPERPLWVGETVEGALEWYLRRQVGNRTFVVPLFDQTDWLDVEPAPAGPDVERLGGFSAGARQIELPYRRDTAQLDGTEYTRFRFAFRLTATRAGVLQAPPPRVMAELEAGVGRDMFGFPVAQRRLFQATGKPLKLEVRPLPLKDRPDSFAGAVGGAFSLEVQAQRTVARVGDPIELRVMVRGDGRLPGLILPDLRKMGLPEAEFAAPEEPASGELLDDGKGKLFRVSVRLKSTAAREIPALRFSYFDPAKATYQSTSSQPIALQVKGSAVVGAADVVGAQGSSPLAGGPQASGPGKGQGGAALLPVGADLALSAEGATLRKAGTLREVAPVLALLYGAPLLLWGFLWRRQRGRREREKRGQVAQALASLEAELEAASSRPAREAAPRILQALRALRGLVAVEEREADRALLTRLEIDGYDPDAARRSLQPELLAQARDLGRAWARGAAALVLLILLLTALAPARAADGNADAALAAARQAYQGALAQTDADQRRDAFVRAEAALRALAATYPDRPELLCDWGNAALLSQDPGHAVLAYRRALSLDPGLVRARQNLAFARGRLPEGLGQPPSRSGLAPMMTSLLSLWPGRGLAPPRRHVLAAAAFALALLLLAPWGRRAGSRTPLLYGPAILLGLLWAGLVLPAASDAEDAVVVQDGLVLRSADSQGAPPVLSRPLPAGVEVQLSESRGEWARVLAPGGITGWLPAAGIERVSR